MNPLKTWLLLATTLAGTLLAVAGLPELEARLAQARKHTTT